MQIRIKEILLTSVFLFMTACTPQITQDLWNGNYATRAASKSFDKQSDAFYAKETMEQKRLRKKNQMDCLTLAELPKNLVHEKGDVHGSWNQKLYKECMNSRGTPVFLGVEKIN